MTTPDFVLALCAKIGTDLLPIKDPAGRVGTVGLLNGRVTLDGNGFTGERAGRVLLR